MDTNAPGPGMKGWLAVAAVCHHVQVREFPSLITQSSSEGSSEWACVPSVTGARAARAVNGREFIRAEEGLLEPPSIWNAWHAPFCCRRFACGCRARISPNFTYAKRALSVNIKIAQGSSGALQTSPLVARATMMDYRRFRVMHQMLFNTDRRQDRRRSRLVSACASAAR